MKNHMKIFEFMILHTKLCLLQNVYVLFLIKLMDVLKIHDEIKYLLLFRSDEKHEKIFDWIRNDIMLKSNISDVFYPRITKIKSNSDDDLPLRKTWNMFDE